jgi:septal ring factor EnvC (AmiA/AmiB activator)
MDPDLKREVLDVRKVIEKSTSKVSLRDLEKKGFRQVKVLRAGDINQLIFKAVQNVLAKQPRGGMSEEERQKIMQEAKADFDRMMSDKKELIAKQNQIEQAHQNLQGKLAQVNAQLAQEKQAVLAERQQFERDKQALMESSLQGQQNAAANFQGQIDDLRTQAAKAEARAEAAEARAAAAEGKAADTISKEEHDQLRRRLNTQLEDVQDDVERYRKQIRTLEEEHEGQLKKLKKDKVEAEDNETRAQGKVKSLEEDKERLEEEVNRLRGELAEAAANKGGGTSAEHDAEFQRLRMEMEQRHARMQDMMAGIANSLVESRQAGGGGGGADFSKQFEALQKNITSAMRKATGAGAEDFDLTVEQASAIFAAQDGVELETNIDNVELKTVKAKGVNSKLAKLRNLRGGG